ncbi:MAG TPA: sugar phosphate isomerase/epimerase [Opitutus sp.]|nr:sugar phosphate isomerase/epimerase [Opitutus sp.]
MKRSLRLFFAAALAALLSCTVTHAAASGPKLGLQSWTCRNMTFDEVVAFAEQHQLKYLQLIAKHIDPKGPREETLRKKAILEQHGLVCYTFGVNGTSLDKEENRKLFEFAKLMGIGLIIVEPKNLAEWDNLEELVKEYDIKLAIHNHGKGTVYGDPATVKKVLAERDARIGVCLDIGWVTAAGFDAAKVFRDYDGRVFDMHLKDKKVEMSGDTAVVLDVEAGAGQSNYDGLFAEIKKSGWSGVMAIETDNANFAKNPHDLVETAKALFATKTK